MSDSTADSQADAAPARNGFARRAQSIWQKTKRFLGGVWNDVDLLVNTGAVRGGGIASLAAIAGIMQAVALPFALAAVTVAGCAALLGLGIYGIVVGSKQAKRRIRDIYNRAAGIDTPDEAAPAPKKSFTDTLRDMPLLQKAARTKLGAAILKSRAWKKAGDIAAKSREAVLGGMALGGSVASIAVGVTYLAAQVMLFPIILAGSAVAATTFMTVHGVIEYVRDRRARKQAVAAAAEQTTHDNPQKMPDALSSAFDDSASPKPAPQPAKPAGPILPKAPGI